MKRFIRRLRFWSYAPVAITRSLLLNDDGAYDRLEQLRVEAEPTVEAYISFRYANASGKTEWHRFHQELRIRQSVKEMTDALLLSAAAKMRELIGEGIPRQNIGKFHLVVPHCEDGACGLRISMDVTPDELEAVA